MTAPMNRRLALLEQVTSPGRELLPYIIHWPEHGTAEEQAATQREIDRRNATGQLVFIIRRAGDYETAADAFI